MATTDRVGPAAALLASYDRHGTLGRLTGIGDADRDRLVRDALRDARAALAEARERAAASGTEVEVDAAPLAGVAEGEVWRVAPDGRVRRVLRRYPSAAALLERMPTATGGRSDGLDAIRPLLLRCAYNGLWSPSGTNWQPMRSVELVPAAATRIASAAGWSPPGGAGLAVLRRARYRSVLADVAALAGFRIEARAERIDAGIFRAVCALTAASHGCAPRIATVPGSRSRSVDRALAALLEAGTGGWAPERSAAIAAALRSGDLTTSFALFADPSGTGLRLEPDAVGGLAASELDRLVWARSSQRTASPYLDLDPREADELLAAARAGIDERAAAGLAWVVLHRDRGELAAIGRAVSEALYGEGADPATGHGGRGGLLGRFTPERVAAALELGGGPGDPVPVAALPTSLRDRLAAMPVVDVSGVVCRDRAGKPLDTAGIARLARGLTVGFGRHFLGFGASHPVTVILLAPPAGRAGAGAAVEALGGLAVRAALLARARGLVSVLKSGPTELARPAVDGVATAVATGGVRAALERGALQSVLVLQVGHPLGPDDEVGPFDDRRNGLVERVRDRRAPRARLSEHYLAVGEVG